MNDNDTRLLYLIQEVKKGNKDVYDEISKLIMDEIYNLVSFVYEKEETRKKLARHVVVKVIRSMDKFDSEEMDIHMWIARFTTIEIYNVYSKQNGNIFNKTHNNLSYEYHSIEEDSVFEDCAAEYNRAFIDIAELNKINDKFSSLTKVQKIIYEMFCYECFTVEEIKDILKVGRPYIINAIAGMKKQLCDNIPQDSSSSKNSVNNIDDVEHTDNMHNTDNSIEISDEEAYELNNIYNNHSRGSHSQYYTIFSKKFPKKTVISVASCAAVLLLAVIVVVVVSIREKNAASNVVNYGQMSTKGTTSKTNHTANTTTAATKKNNEQTTQTKENTEIQTEQSTTKNNQKPVSGNQDNPIQGRPVSPSVNNPTSASVNEPDTQEPESNTEESTGSVTQDPTNPTQEDTDPTKPTDEDTDPTKPTDEDTDPTKPTDDNPEDSTKKPDDKPDNTQNPNGDSDDIQNSSDNVDEED